MVWHDVVTTVTQLNDDITDMRVGFDKRADRAGTLGHLGRD